MGDDRDLLAWQRARALAGSIYRATEWFPALERFGSAAQMRRAAVSVVSNIAEGAGRGSDLELRRFLQIARGSLGELQTQITLAADLRLIPDETAQALSESAADAARLIYGLVRTYAPRPKA
jgi:four helix bundle protein